MRLVMRNLYPTPATCLPNLRRNSATLEDLEDCLVPSCGAGGRAAGEDRKSTRLNSSHGSSSYAVFCLKKKMNATARSAVALTLEGGYGSILSNRLDERSTAAYS